MSVRVYNYVHNLEIDAAMDAFVGVKHIEAIHYVQAHRAEIVCAEVRQKNLGEVRGRKYEKIRRCLNGGGRGRGGFFGG